MQVGLDCTAARGLDDARAVALSPDGKSLYVASSTPATITTFNVDARTGLLQQLNLSAGCLTSIAQPDCGDARALEGATAIVVSPDGLHVYAAAAGAGAVTSFVRQPNGSLVQLVGIAGCITTTLTPGCSNAPALAGADAIAISPDGRFVYVGAAGADAITVFSRDAATGRLTPAGRRRGLPARQPHRLHSGQRRRRALGDRDLARRDVALRHLDGRHARGVPARRRFGDARAAPARVRLPERRRLRRLHADRRPRARLGRRRLARRGNGGRRQAPTTPPCSRSGAIRPPARSRASRAWRATPRPRAACPRRS